MFPIFVLSLFIVVTTASTTDNTFPPWILPPLITACGPNGRLSICAPKCGTKCSNYKDNLPCTEKCVKGCRCNKGYIIDDDSGLCISPQYCGEIVQKPKNKN